MLWWNLTLSEMYPNFPWSNLRDICFIVALPFYTVKDNIQVSSVLGVHQEDLSLLKDSVSWMTVIAYELFECICKDFFPKIKDSDELITLKKF